MVTFGKWLDQQADREDGTGDLARCVNGLNPKPRKYSVSGLLKELQGNDGVSQDWLAHTYQIAVAEYHKSGGDPDNVIPFERMQEQNPPPWAGDQPENQLAELRAQVSEMQRVIDRIADKLGVHPIPLAWPQMWQLADFAGADAAGADEAATG
jgi:hypothetical protein